MSLDFIGFIGQNVSLSAGKKQAMLDDFVEQYGYEEQIDDGDGGLIPNPVSKKAFANDKIQRFVMETVHAVRKRRVEQATTFEELILS